MKLLLAENFLLRPAEERPPSAGRSRPGAAAARTGASEEAPNCPEHRAQAGVDWLLSYYQVSVTFTADMF